MRMPSALYEPGSWLDRIMTFIMANMVWFALSVFIIPLPAATAGFFAALAPWVRGQDVEFFATFFGTIRRKWLKSTVIGLLDLIFAVMLVINFRILNVMGLPDLMLGLLRGFYAAIALLVLLANVYVWPLLALFDLPLRRLLSLSLRLAFVYPWRSLLTLALALLPLSVVLFAPLWLFVIGLVSGCVLILNWGAWRIIRQVATPEELAEIHHSP